MTKILFIAYHFPPVGGGGVQRNAKFVRYLADHGYEPIVVAGERGGTDRWAPEDETLLDEIADCADVRRISGPEPVQEGLRASLEWRLGLKTAHVRWWLDGVVRTGVAAGGDVDLVYASLIPYETAEAAAEIARRIGKPWIADLQDPWALDEMWLYPSAVHRAIDLRRMRRLLGSAAAIVMNTDEAAARLLRSFPELRDRLVTSIPNGFDAADFVGEPPERSKARFRIVHAGYLHTEHGLRLRRTRRLRRLLGGSAPVDILPRSHVYLLRALERLLLAEPELGSNLELVLAGVLTDLDRQIAESSAVAVDLPGYLTHAATVDLMRSADLLFLPMHDLLDGRRAGLVPGKTYEYLAARRPILGAVPPGDARDLLLDAGSAFVCAPTDIDAMTRIVADCVRRWQSGEDGPMPDETVLARYDRRELTRRLVAVFDRVLEGARDVLVA